MDQPRIVLRNDFEGARLGSGSVIGDEIHIELLFDIPVVADWKTHDYRLHFTFGIENTGPDDREIRVRVGGASRETLPQVAPLIYKSDNPLSGYAPHRVTGATDQYQLYDFDVLVEGNKVTYVANCLPRPLSLLSGKLDKLASAGGAKRLVFGRSLEGRELVTYQYGTGNKPAVLISSGIHPPEPDTLATEALMELMKEPAGARLREHFDFYIAPVLNPDGYAHGSQAGNAAGINFYWDFRHQDKRFCPEAVAFYELACEIRPLMYFDFHAYTFQWQKHASPYIKPLSRYRGVDVRKVVGRINSALLTKVSDSKSMTGFVTYAPSTLGEKLTRKFNTISYAKYHIHLKDGVDNCRQHAVSAVLTACSTLLDADMAHNQRVLCVPYGGVGREPIAELRRRLAIYWFGWFRPKLESVYANMSPELRNIVQRIRKPGARNTA